MPSPRCHLRPGASWCILLWLDYQSFVNHWMHSILLPRWANTHGNHVMQLLRERHYKVQPILGQNNSAHSSTQERKLLRKTSESLQEKTMVHVISTHVSDGKSWHGQVWGNVNYTREIGSRVLECFRSGQSHQGRQRASKIESITVTSRWLTLNHSLWGFMEAEVGAFQGEKRAVHTPYPTNPSTYLGTWGRTHYPWFWCRKGRPGSRVKRQSREYLWTQR